MKCSVKSCQNRSDLQTGLKFHSFPKDHSIRDKWIVSCRRDPTYDVKHKRVCSAHFLKTSYRTPKLLHFDAVPSIATDSPEEELVIEIEDSLDNETFETICRRKRDTDTNSSEDIPSTVNPVEQIETEHMDYVDEDVEMSELPRTVECMVNGEGESDRTVPGYTMETVMDIVFKWTLDKFGEAGIEKIVAHQRAQKSRRSLKSLYNELLAMGLIRSDPNY